MWTKAAGRRLTAAIAFLFAAACQQLDNPGKVAPGSPNVDGTRSSELQRSQLDDVPVPRDMQLITRANQSFMYAAPSVRVGRFKYRGEAPPEDVAAFYRANMPLAAYGWTPASENDANGRTALQFRKGNDVCDVTVERDNGETTLMVLVNCGPMK